MLHELLVGFVFVGLLFSPCLAAWLAQAEREHTQGTALKRKRLRFF